MELKFGGPWSEIKLACVEQYTKAYLRVMKNQSWRLQYVDAFAGSGLQKVKKTAHGSEKIASLFGDEPEDQDAARLFIEGSPLRAIRASMSASRGFDEFVFVDANSRACGDLQRRIANEFTDLLPKMQFLQEDANAFLKRYASQYDRLRCRSLVFLDPFGCEVAWDTVEALGKTQACDVWYLFPLSGAIRMMTHSGQIDPAWESTLDMIFGSHEWRDHFYETMTQETLFGDVEETHRDAAPSKVVDYVVDRLRGIFADVGEPAVLRNSHNSPMFALVFAVANPAAKELALSIANHLTRKLNAQP